jgi:uncharacterized protein (TIGR00251 family)
MRKEIKVTASAGADEVVEKDGILLVRVRAPAEGNKANMSVMNLLSKHFGRPVRIVSGFRSRRKAVEIGDSF